MEILKKIFVENWIRKAISFLLAILSWFVVHESLKTPKNYTSNLTNSIEEIK
jgi:YbbR domain-containing protein